jgi:hypothetical protein
MFGGSFNCHTGGEEGCFTIYCIKVMDAIKYPTGPRIAVPTRNHIAERSGRAEVEKLQVISLHSFKAPCKRTFVKLITLFLWFVCVREKEKEGCHNAAHMGFNSHAAQTGLKGAILLPLLPECWDYKSVHHVWLNLLVKNLSELQDFKST